MLYRQVHSYADLCNCADQEQFEDEDYAVEAFLHHVFTRTRAQVHLNGRHIHSVRLGSMVIPDRFSKLPAGEA